MTKTRQDFEVEEEPEEVKALRDAIDLIDAALDAAAGHDRYSRRLCAYYAAATWHLGKFDKFPALAIYSALAAGKTQVLKVMEWICLNPYSFDARKVTDATLREVFNQAQNGTLLIEEADGVELEPWVHGRYAKETAKAAKMAPVGARGWEKREYYTFGATVLHKREPFNDAALESRCIWLAVHPNRQRPRDSYSLPPEYMTDLIKQLLREASKIELAKRAQVPGNIAGRVIDVYEPILLLAEVAEDTEFRGWLIGTHMRLADAAVKDGQTWEPSALVIKALLAVLAERGSGTSLDYSKPVKVDKDLVTRLRSDYQISMHPRKVTKIVRDQGFRLRSSGGIIVIDIDLNTLAAACIRFGIEDELLEKALKQP